MGGEISRGGRHLGTGDRGQKSADLRDAEIESLKLLCAVPGIPRALLRASFVKARLPLGAEVRLPFGGELRHARRGFEEDAEEEIRWAMVEACDRDQPTEIGEVVEPNALL
jgi:hypothetical protein